MITHRLIFKIMFSFYHLVYYCNIKYVCELSSKSVGELSSNLSVNCLPKTCVGEVSFGELSYFLLRLQLNSFMRLLEDLLVQNLVIGFTFFLLYFMYRP